MTTVLTHAFESAHGREPRGKNAWTFMVGNEPFKFDGKYFAGRAAAIERAAALGATTISVLPLLDAPSLAPAIEPAPTATAPAPVVEPARPAAIVNVSTDATLPEIKCKPAPEALAPVTEVIFASIYLDHPVVGCGERLYQVLDMSPTQVRLLYLASLEVIEIDRALFDRKHTVPGRHKCSKAKVEAVIRKRIALADKINDEQGADTLPDGGVYAQRALALIAA